MIGFRFIPRFFSSTGFSDVQSALTITSPASGDVIYQTIPTTISGTIARGTEFTAARLLVNGVPYNTISAFTITATEWSCPFTPVDAGITSLTVQFTHPNGFTFTAQTISLAVSAASGSLPTSYTGLISWHAPTGATIETSYMNQAPSAFATQNNVTHTAGISDPDGGTAAYRMTDNATNAVHDVINTSGNWLGVTKQPGEVEYRAIVTRAPASTLNFVIGQSESQGVNINLGTGTLTNVGINAIFKSQAAYATSWFDLRAVVSVSTQTCLLLSNGSAGAGYIGTGKSVDMFCPTYWGQQRQITTVVDYSGNTYNLSPASAAARFIALDDLSGGKLFGCLTAGIAKTAPFNSATQTALAGSFTVVMRVYVNSVAAGTVNWLAITGSGSRTMVIRRNGAVLELFRYNNAAESGTATLATITTGFHTIAVTFNATTGQATCYYDKSAGTTHTAISGVLTPTAGILTTNGYSISEMAIYSEVRSKADCDALADGMTARKGNI